MWVAMGCGEVLLVHSRAQEGQVAVRKHGSPKGTAAAIASASMTVVAGGGILWKAMIRTAAAVAKLA